MPITLYRYLSVIVFVISGIALMYEHYIIGAIVFFSGIGVAQGYRCPYCNKAFDIRMGKRQLQHCPNCGKRIN